MKAKMTKARMKEIKEKKRLAAQKWYAKHGKKYYSKYYKLHPRTKPKAA